MAVVLSVLRISKRADTAEQGHLLFEALYSALKQQSGVVVVSFDGLTSMTTSFANLSFARLLSEFSLTELKSRLRVIDSTRQINEMIRLRLEGGSRAPQLNHDEESKSGLEFYDRSGIATAYLIDETHIYDWNGNPSAYIQDDRVYRYDGKIIGWYSKGFIFDVHGDAVLFSTGAQGGPSKPMRKMKPLKKLRKLRPLKSLRQSAPARPAFSLKWSAIKWQDLM